MKIVINNSYNSFSLSREIIMFMADAGNAEAKHILNKDNNRSSNFYSNFCRSDPDLVAAVEYIRKKEIGSYYGLVVIEIPDGVNWIIENYDNVEYVAERHRTWRYGD